MRYRSITMIDGDEPARVIELHADTRSHVVATNEIPRPGIGFAVMHAAHRIDAQALTEVMALRCDCD
ncbi:hypothetical protein B9Z07_10475 [Burkholderia cenocepacia]|uniref:Uncharacterized protein n=2 Tax=Burkholderia TaxID=32008 RepID=A0AAD0J146_9BURK|nr:hypothetical protein B9Z07_10475 [Burkholderia cenocepacia]PRE36852.1 hypothetical protein C6P63_11110 [Burkholderia cenocepacia]